MKPASRAIALLLYWIASPLCAGVNEGSYEVLENGAERFAVELSDTLHGTIRLRGVEEVRVDDIVFDSRSVPEDSGTQGHEGASRATRYRAYEPLGVYYGNITLRVNPDAAGNELYEWWLDARSGGNVRKSISVIALKRDGSEARRWNIREALPVSCAGPGKQRDEEPLACETIVAKMGRVELQSAGDGAGDPPLDAGVYAAILSEGADPLLGAPWARWQGGGELLVTRDAGVGSDQFHTSTPGHKTVDEITLRGPLTSGRKALSDWITTWTRSGAPLRATVTIKEITKDGGAGKTFIYHDCIPTRYVFPAFSAGSTGLLYEEIGIKPIRMELS